MNSPSLLAIVPSADGFDVYCFHRLGQAYEWVDGYGLPFYVTRAERACSCETFNEAMAFIAGVRRGGGAGRLRLEHPTWTGSMGMPGAYELDPDGGPLYALVDDPAQRGKETPHRVSGEER